MSKAVSPSPLTDEEEEISLLDFWLVIWKRRYVIGGLCGLAILFAMIVIPTQAKIFKSTTSVFPHTKDSTMLVWMLKSRIMVEEVVKHYNLTEHYKAETLEDARRELEGKTEIKVLAGRIISITVADIAHQMAADIANYYVTNLDRVNRTLNASKFSRDRIFLEKQLQENEHQLAKAGEALKAFQIENKTRVDALLPMMALTAAEIQWGIIAQKVQIQMLNEYLSPADPAFIRAQSDLNALNRQLSRFESEVEGKGLLPAHRLHPAMKTESDLGLSYGHLLRDLMVQETLQILLTSQFEQVKLEEARGAPSIQVLDSAVPADRETKRGTTVIIMGAGVVGLFIGIVLAFFLEYLERIRTNHRPVSPSHAVG